MPKTPGDYRTPLRSRSDIAAYLASVGGYDSTYGRNGRSYFAFNVKCHGVRLGFEHLIEVYRNGGYYGDGETWLDDPEWRDVARELEYPTLRKLYALVVMLSHDLTPEKASSEVEHHAAFSFIENVCSDIPRHDSIQRLLPLAG